MNGDIFIEVGHFCCRKHGQGAEGDVFLSRKTDDGRIISVLSDGLGSGIKAGVLATLTATMAAKFVAEDMPPKQAARIIMKTLPVCKERGISYATFTLVDIDSQSQVKIIEYDNPAYLLFRQASEPVLLEPLKRDLVVKRPAGSRSAAGSERYPKQNQNLNQNQGPNRYSQETSSGTATLLARAVMHYSEFQAKAGDRLVIFSDGVAQSGMGTKAFPLGWGIPRIQAYVMKVLQESPDMSARRLAQVLVKEAESHDAYRAKDDITCAVIYFRKPRRLLLMTGPSIDPGRDAEMARIFQDFHGARVLCGGTTASIIARELGRSIKVNLKHIDPGIPPASTMDGADLVTEGIITLGKVTELLEAPASAERYRTNPATQLTELLLNSDCIEFVVGTKINEAHQDPTMPVELEIRRNIIKRIAGLLEEKYLKEIKIRFI
jgi:hypothetical protein